MVSGVYRLTMRILHLIPSLSGGGAERQLSYLAPELAHSGHDVHIAYTKDGPDKPELPGTTLHPLKFRSNYNPYLFWQIFKLIRHIKPDIVHTWITQMDIWGGIAAGFNHVPWVFREPSSVKAYLQPTWKDNLRIKVGSHASVIVSNSQGGNEYWKTQLPNSIHKIVVNGLPLQEIELSNDYLPFDLEKKNVPIILYVGRIIGLKNPQFFLEAIASVKKEQAVLGVICGEGNQRPQMENLIHTLNLDADVHFTGHLSASTIWTLMKKSAVFVSLSKYEGCPNTVMEAMACDCPLVISDIPAHREILDESCAAFVNPSNIQQVSETILQTLSNRDASKKRTVIAKQKVQEWSIAKIAENWEILYKEILLK